MPEPRSHRFAHGRHAGVIAPLFSIPSASSWGIGEIADLPQLAAWLTSAGLDFVQLLPINEMPGGQTSPYSALSAMAIDPIFIAVEPLEDFRGAGGVDAMSPEGRERVSRLRQSTRVDYGTVRAAKRRGAAARLRSVHLREYSAVVARPQVRRVRLRRGVVDRQLRAVPGIARRACGLATGASGSRACAIAIPPP